MRLWLDDERDPRVYANGKGVPWVWVTTAKMAIEYIKTGRVTLASLDHDLGLDDGGLTGYDVVCWMEETNIWPVDGVLVHGMNPVGRERMQAVIDKHYSGA